MTTDRIALTRAARVAAEAGYHGFSYRYLYLAVLDGRLPAEQMPNGRYVVASADVIEFARSCGNRAAA